MVSAWGIARVFLDRCGIDSQHLQKEKIMKESTTELMGEYVAIRDALINGELGADQVERLCFVPIRDAVLRFGFDNPDFRPTLIENIKKLDPNTELERACLATLCAGISLLDDLREQCAEFVSQALDADSGYSLARLLHVAIGADIPASVWADSLENVSIDQCLAGAI